MMINWWKKNGWKIRIHIYTIITLPIDLLEDLVEFLAKLYRKFFEWLLWKLMNKIFCNKKEQ